MNNHNLNAKSNFYFIQHIINKKKAETSTIQDERIIEKVKSFPRFK